MEISTDYTLTQTPAERIVDAINEISMVCDGEILVVPADNSGPLVTIIINDANMFEEIVSLGEALSQVN
jgi:hypothetical protein